MRRISDYHSILRTLQELPFGVGKALLIHVLQGNVSEKKILKNSLNMLDSFGCLEHLERGEIENRIRTLQKQQFIEHRELATNRFIKVLALSDKGIEELKSPHTISPKKFVFDAQPVTEDEKSLIASLSFFLGKYNQQQAKAIISDSSKMLCVAGAGSGKTTVLTKRIEFLCKFKSVNPDKILAITFTRKAKQEMQQRLAELQVPGVHVETFNSFCEKVVQKHWQKLYSQKGRIVTYGEKIKITLLAIKEQNLTFDAIKETYFTSSQKRTKTQEELLRQFASDCFTIIDHFKNENKQFADFTSQFSRYPAKQNAQYLYQVCKVIQEIMHAKNLRDYSDQLTDALAIFIKHPETIPQYYHILVDEYQDVNAIQVDLLKLLNPANLFVVGDPRQAIFGWRGSNIEFIKSFPKRHENATTIVLEQNYRSHPTIVSIANSVVTTMNIQDQAAGRKEEEFSQVECKLFNFITEEQEREFVVREIKNLSFPLDEIFVLARTNRQLGDLTTLLRAMGIPYILKTEDVKTSVKQGHVTLATVHAIKGLEAECVFTIGCNGLYFPCTVSDHPVVESLNLNNYDKEEEERRLLYVAITRAKQRLYLSYTGKSPSMFITKETRKFLGEQEHVAPVPRTIRVSRGSDANVYSLLREWRRDQSRALGVPAYMVLNDKSIEEISNMLPTCVEELGNIYGIGPRKVEKYGEDIIRIVQG